ncbi:hypothetical protein ANCDUO_10000 [Ancylostoma duodenale]|uniref:Uncharacterized protein n=1 Tax=Ancylostoma duodenale TaxID=51022 RepID=A0A0C2CSE2_9BILA|nr:hypothetical protein ANCDUO_10000 [Ancylostoma duodenale]
MGRNPDRRPPRHGCQRFSGRIPRREGQTLDGPFGHHPLQRTESPVPSSDSQATHWSCLLRAHQSARCTQRDPGRDGGDPREERDRLDQV